MEKSTVAEWLTCHDKIANAFHDCEVPYIEHPNQWPGSCHHLEGRGVYSVTRRTANKRVHPSQECHVNPNSWSSTIREGVAQISRRSGPLAESEVLPRGIQMV